MKSIFCVFILLGGATRAVGLRLRPEPLPEVLFGPLPDLPDEPEEPEVVESYEAWAERQPVNMTEALGAWWW